MEFPYISIADLAANGYWLFAVPVIASALPAALALHYRRLYLRARGEQANHRDLIENLSEGIYRSAPDGRQLSANKALVRLNGYDNEAEMLASVGDIGKEWYVDPGRRDEFRAILKRDGHVEDFVSEIYRHKSRERIWITESARLVHGKSGEPLYYEGSVRDITETMTKRTIEELLLKLSEQVPGGLFQFVRDTNGAWRVPYISSGFRALYGLKDGEALFSPQQFIDMVHPDHRQTFFEGVLGSEEGSTPWDCEFRAVTLDGADKWLRITAKPERTADGVIWHGYIEDVTARKNNEMEIEKLAFYDPLTGLPNRRRFMQRMGNAVASSRLRQRCGALIFIDLDNFKTLNDTHGHDVGDEYLAQVARRLGGCVRPQDMVARMGGDEFVVLLENAGRDTANASRLAIMTANKVLEAVRDDYEVGCFSHRSSASLGVAVFNGSDGGPDEIIKQADIAMYQAKAAGRNGMAFYDHTSMSPESDRYRLLAEFRKALSSDTLELYFQPQVDDNGRIVGAEALARWHHPERGTLLPERFVPLTEQFGLISEFGGVVLAKGIAELARWKDNEATAGLRMAINVNVQSFAREDFVPNLAALIAGHGVDARLLTLELTENVMTKDRKLIARRMRDLKALGVRLSLDDFGSGYSSLAQLKRLPFDELKIDGSFIADIEAGESDRQLVKSILGTARTLKLTAVAEHVENQRQEGFLRAFGCDFFQGWLYSPALTASAFLAHVERHHGVDTLAGRPIIRCSA